MDLIKITFENQEIMDQFRSVFSKTLNLETVQRTKCTFYTEYKESLKQELQDPDFEKEWKITEWRTYRDEEQ